VTNADAVNPLQVIEAANAQRLALDAATTEALTRFGDLFLAWNARINLGGRISAAQLVAQHFTDAFAALKFIGPGELVADVGSGGGLPLLPMAIVRRDASFEAWEPTGKKVAFLRTAVRQFSLGGTVTIHPGRVSEPLDAAQRGRFDVAGSRAAFPPAEWLSMGLQLVRVGGRVIVFGTSEVVSGPQPTEVYSYGPTRRLLVFTKPELVLEPGVDH
jgi:16S rRNA (guanine527-N7)-methyltransferase